MAKSDKAPNEIPVTKTATGPNGQGDSADMDVNVQQHKFSGQTCEIKIFKGDKEDPKHQFFSVNHYHITIERDKWVRIPVEMADHIESLVQTVKEPDPQFPDDDNKFIWADKQRFPLQRRD